MPKIKVLPESIARKIAAGEVIERPASVVKELVENAFDAQARRVEVEIEEGGLRLIRVRDDGQGMEPEDLKQCYLPHATSKISSAEDLLRIETWGFRGEALAAIAAVSRLKISSRPAEALLGACVEVVFGKEASFRECGHPKGTIVEAKDLFANVPARRAFMKGPRAEGSRVTEVMKILALENPSVSLKLKLKERTTFSYHQETGRKGLLAAWTGVREEDFLEEVLVQGPYTLEVLLSKPAVRFPTARHFYFLVNQRLVRDKILLSAALEGLALAFPRGQYPVLLLSLKLPPELVDVNVHPTKGEVRFKQEREVFQAVRRALEDVLKPKVKISAPISSSSNAEEDLPLAPPREKTAFSPPAGAQPYPSAGLKISEPEGLYSKKEWRAIGPLAREFYLCESPKGLLILDYHAAHERLLFERLKEAYAQGGLPRQKLLFPHVLVLSVEALERLESHRPFLERLGYSFDQGGPREVLVRAVPALVGEGAVLALQEILEQALLQEPGRILHEVLASLACHRARRAGEAPPPEEVEKLCAELKSQGLETCPHGRAIFWEISLDEIQRRLGRKV